MGPTAERSFPPGLGGARVARVAFATGLVVLLHAPWAGAWCRTTTCDPKDGDVCDDLDGDGCGGDIGLDLYWPEKCLSFGVQKSGSTRQNISFDTANAIIEQAFRSWSSVTCDGGTTPSFRVWNVGDNGDDIECNVPEFNKNEPNANIWMFRDEAWPYVGQGSTLALTTITFEVPTGQILDADVEVNATVEITTGDQRNVENDLLSIATHEAGHFLGLAHSLDGDATMYENYDPGSLDFRTLERDDVEGICAAYPPDRPGPECSSPRPRHGFSRFCAEPVTREGCSVAPAAGPESTAGATAFGVALAGFAASGRLRRRPRRAKSR